MTLAASLTALCDLLRTNTGAEVFLGEPDDESPGIYVWPWRIEDQPRARNLPGVGAPTLRPGATVRLLILVRPALSVEGLSRLDAARAAIDANPVIDLPGTRIGIMFERIGDDDLARVFLAASIPLTICVAARLTAVDSQGEPTAP